MAEYEQPMHAAEAARFAGIGRSTLWRYVKDKRFPEPIKNGGVTIGWTRGQIINWQQALIQQAMAM